MNKLVIFLILIVAVYSVSIDKAVAYLKAHAHKKSTGYCAKYVANALEAGGFKFTRQPSAYLYHTKGIIKKLGFTPISRPSKPKKGDIYVQDKNSSHPDGHIAMFSGSKWISDFIQNSDQVYRNNPGKRYYYRYKK